MRAGRARVASISSSVPGKPAFCFMRMAAWGAIPLGLLYLFGLFHSGLQEWLAAIAYMKWIEQWKDLNFLLSVSLDFLGFLAVIPAAVYALIRTDRHFTELAIKCAPGQSLQPPGINTFPALCVFVCWVTGGVMGLLLMESGLVLQRCDLTVQGVCAIASGFVCGTACEELRLLLWRQTQYGQWLSPLEQERPKRPQNRMWPSWANWILYPALILFLLLPAACTALNELGHLNNFEQPHTVYEILLYGHLAIFFVFAVFHLGLVHQAIRSWSLRRTAAARKAIRRAVQTVPLSDKPLLILGILIVLLFIVAGMGSAGMARLIPIALVTFILIGVRWDQSRKGIREGAAFLSTTPVLLAVWWSVFLPCAIARTVNSGGISPLGVIWVETLLLWQIGSWRKRQQRGLSQRFGQFIEPSLAGWQRACLIAVLLPAMVAFGLHIAQLATQVATSDLPMKLASDRIWWDVHYPSSHPLSPSMPLFFPVLDSERCISELVAGRLMVVSHSLIHLLFMALLMREFFLMVQVAAEARRRLGSQEQKNADATVHCDSSPAARTSVSSATYGIPEVNA